MGGQDGLRADADVSDIFAAERLWRGRLLTTGHLSCRHPIVVCAGRGVKVAVAGRSVAWACSGRGAALLPFLVKLIRMIRGLANLRSGGVSQKAHSQPQPCLDV